MRLGKFRPADEQITVAKQLSPNDPAISVDAAQIYAGENKMREAQDEFNRALALAPRSATVLGSTPISLLHISRSLRHVPASNNSSPRIRMTQMAI